MIKMNNTLTFLNLLFSLHVHFNPNEWIIWKQLKSGSCVDIIMFGKKRMGRIRRTCPCDSLTHTTLCHFLFFKGLLFISFFTISIFLTFQITYPPLISLPFVLSHKPFSHTHTHTNLIIIYLDNRLI